MTFFCFFSDNYFQVLGKLLNTARKMADKEGLEKGYRIGKWRKKTEDWCMKLIKALTKGGGGIKGTTAQLSDPREMWEAI